MTIRTLFSIILKVLGLFFIKDILGVLPQILSSVLFLIDTGTLNESIYPVLLLLVTLIIYIIISWALVFKTSDIIDKLKIDQGFDDDTISINTHRSTILSIAIIVIGGLIVVDEVPNLCWRLFSYFQEKRMTYGQTDPSISFSVLSGAKIIIGILLMLEQRKIVNLIERQRKKG